MDENMAMAINQNQLAIERTELAKMRTELAFSNSKLSLERTHMSYLRTIVSLIGSAATIYKALPMLGVSENFTSMLTLFLLFFSIYFVYKDSVTYPRMKRKLEEMHAQALELSLETQREIDILLAEE